MSTQPQAHIALNNNRLKSYADVVYLKDNDEFQIELFNPHKQSVLTKIWINDQLISDSGLVLKPGMRYFLDRYIDENRKFKFSTYKVQGNIAEVLEAIKNNGSIRVEFYAEVTKTPYPTTAPYWYKVDYFQDRRIYSGPVYGTNQFNGVPNGSTTTLNTQNAFYCSNDTANLSNQGTFTYSTNSIPFAGTSGVAGKSGMSGVLRSQSLEKEVTTDSVEDLETGRIEKGGKSKQQFTTIDANFHTIPMQIVDLKILPESQKPIETTEIRNYCSECGTRMKKQSWKFCPNCGNEL